MGSDKENIDELYRNKLEDFAPDTPYDAWPDVRNSIERRSRRKRIAFWRNGSIAAALLLAFATGYFFKGFEPSGQNIIAPIEETGNKKKTDSPSKVVPEKADTSLNNTIKTNTAESKVQPDLQMESSAASATFRPTVKNAPAKDSRLASEADFKAYLLNSNTPDKPDFDVSMKGMIDTYRREKGSILGRPANPSSSDLASTAETIDNDSTLLEISQSDMVYNESRLNKNVIDARQLHPNYRPYFEITAQGGPSIPFRNVSYSEDNSTARQNIENENLNNSYSAGVKIAYNTPGNWELQAGVYINNWEQRMDEVLLETGVNNSPTSSSPDVNGITSTGDINLDPTQPGVVENGFNGITLVPDILQSYQYIDIPIGAAYYFLENKFKMKIQAAVNPRILSKSTVELLYPDGTTEIKNNLRPADFSLQLRAGPGFSYQLGPKINVQLDPLILYGLTPIDRSSDFDTYHHQFIIYSGFSYRF